MDTFRNEGQMNGVRNKTDTSIVLFSSKFPRYTKSLVKGFL